MPQDRNIAESGKHAKRPDEGVSHNEGGTCEVTPSLLDIPEFLTSPGVPALRWHSIRRIFGHPSQWTRGALGKATAPA
jgi:hypothetical protein